MKELDWVFFEDLSKGEVFHFKTFITNEMLYSNQTKDVDLLSEEFKTYWDGFYDFKLKRLRE